MRDELTSAEEIRARLIAARETSGLSGAELARRTGIPRATVMALFSGRLLFGAQRVWRLLEACGFRVTIHREKGDSGAMVNLGRGKNGTVSG